MTADISLNKSIKSIFGDDVTYKLYIGFVAVIYSSKVQSI
jgi:hypothetical protein